ncbi:MAG: DUF4280 domain-containing protein [Cyanobacteria bacterium SBLK]|nr:DUF4280 domain-containing protein [Cyanobacteria bacterium SBLK]
MPSVVVFGGVITCSMGTAPTSLITTSNSTVSASYIPAATVMDYAPISNIPTFVLCKSTTNPTTIAATAAASGVYTMGPCIPATSSPWSPGATKTKINGISVLTDSSKCTCSYGGSISITYAGQFKVSAS